MNERHEQCSGHRHDGPSNQWWSELALVFKSLGKFLADWWDRDRIRVSPTSGRFLCLRKDDSILLRDRLFEVQGFSESTEDRFVVYILRGESGPAFLKVKRDDRGQASEGWLEQAGFNEAVFDDDVVVLPRNG